MYVDVDQFLVAVKKKLFDVFKVYEKSYLKFKLILPKLFFRPKKFFDMADCTDTSFYVIQRYSP